MEDASPSSGPSVGDASDDLVTVTVAGVGRLGTAAVDAVLRRRDAAEAAATGTATADPAARVWTDDRLAYGVLSSNVVDLRGSYVAATTDADDATLADDCLVGRDVNGTGEGLRYGRTLIESDRRADGGFGDRWGVRSMADDRRLDRRLLADAQTLVFVHAGHTTVGGGVTPTLAARRAELTAGTDRSTVSVLLAPPTALDCERPTAALADTADRMAEATDAVVLADFRSTQRTLLGPELAAFRRDRYDEALRPVVGFLERLLGATVESQRDGNTTDAAPWLAPTAADRAPLLAPFLDRESSWKFGVDEQWLEFAVKSAVANGRLVECDPATARGVTVGFFGPPELATEVGDLLDDHAGRVLGDALDAGDDLRVSSRYVPVEEPATVSVAGVLRNPEFDWLESASGTDRIE